MLLDRYRLESEIGSGSMGAVYRALDTRLNRCVAIKLWRGEGPSGVAPQRMLKEARAASALNHPNIVIVHEFGETPNGDAFIVQEFIEGRTLRDRLGEPLPLGEALDVAAQVARALAAAHAVGIVHRDVKPENVMVRGDGCAKMLDFGIAHLPDVTAGADGSTLQTLANDLIGTPAYMSPEVMLGGTIGPAADVFALGVILYEAITGRQPFVGPTAMAVLVQIATATPAPMRSLDPSVPGALDALVETMLDRAPERRPTAAEVEHALRAIAASAPTEAEAEAETEAEAPAPVATITVGREADLARLLALHDGVQGGRSVFVGVSGEPGIGKTTLLEAFMATLRRTAVPPTVVRVRCSESLAGNEAYLPVLEALDALRSRADGAFGRLLHEVAPTWHAQLGGVPADGAAAAAAPSPERMKRELRAFLCEASRGAPLVWIIEDLHWADVSTIDIVNYVAARFEGMRLMLVAAFRPTDLSLARHPFLGVRADLQAKGVYAELPLHFLTRDDVARYLALRWPGHRFPDGFAGEIHARTDGSPLFMTDVVRYLHETGTIAEVDGVWSVAESRAEAMRNLPASARGMIDRKIERLDHADRQLLLAASVQGEEFDSAALVEALQMDGAEVEERLAALHEVHGFVRAGEEVEYPDGSLTLRYRFVHVLYQNVLHASLQPARRVALCRLTAEALAAHHAGDADAAGRLAVLFEAARDFAAAGRHFHQAAQRAVSLFGFHEALRLAERGLAGVARLPAGPARAQLELALQMMRGLAVRLVRGWAAADLEPTFARARQLCQELDNPPELVPVLWNVALFSLIRGHLPTVREQTATLTVIAEAAGDPAWMMAARHMEGVTCEFVGEMQRSTALLEDAIALHEPARHGEYSALFGVDPGMLARSMSTRPLWWVGHPDRALARGHQTIALCRSQRQPVTLVFALLIAEGGHVYRGEPQEAIALGDEVAALCQEYGFAQELQWGRCFQGSAYAQAGDTARGIELLRAGLDGLESLRAGLARSMFLSLLAEAYWRAGRVDDGLATVAAGFAHAEHAVEAGFLSELHRLQGELLASAGRLDEAEPPLRAAVAHARDIAARALELRAATGLARLLGRTGRAAEGRAVLEPVHAWFTEGHGTADLIAARTLLTDLHR